MINHCCSLWLYYSKFWSLHHPSYCNGKCLFRVSTFLWHPHTLGLHWRLVRVHKVNESKNWNWLNKKVYCSGFYPIHPRCQPPSSLVLNVYWLYNDISRFVLLAWNCNIWFGATFWPLIPTKDHHDKLFYILPCKVSTKLRNVWCIIVDAVCMFPDKRTSGSLSESQGVLPTCCKYHFTHECNVQVLWICGKIFIICDLTGVLRPENGVPQPHSWSPRFFNDRWEFCWQSMVCHL